MASATLAEVPFGAEGGTATSDKWAEGSRLPLRDFYHCRSRSSLAGSLRWAAG